MQGRAWAMQGTGSVDNAIYTCLLSQREKVHDWRAFRVNQFPKHGQNLLKSAVYTLAGLYSSIWIFTPRL